MTANKEFLDHAEYVEQLEEFSAPLKPSPEGTEFLTISEVGKDKRKNAAKDEDPTYWFVDVQRIDGNKLADVPCRWFLNQTQTKLLAPFVRENGGEIKHRAFRLTGQPTTKKVFGKDTTVYDDVVLERIKAKDKLAKTAIDLSAR